MLVAATAAQQNADQSWQFAVSGDFRAMYGVDEDLRSAMAGKLTLREYRQMHGPISSRMKYMRSIRFRSAMALAITN